MTALEDDLDDAQVDELRGDLDRARGELEAMLDRTAEGARPVDLDEPIGRLSRMEAMQQQQMTKASQRSAQVRHDLVMSALAAIDAERYGDCRRCEEPIGWRRLKARPESAFCLACQTAVERREGL